METNYTLLKSSDTIKIDDEFLEDDCKTWTKITKGSQSVFVGLEYKTGFFVPIRRLV